MRIALASLALFTIAMLTGWSQTRPMNAAERIAYERHMAGGATLCGANPFCKGTR